MHIITGLLISALLGKKQKNDSSADRSQVLTWHGILETRHSIPGRIRLFAPVLMEHEDAGSGLVKELSKIDGITGVHVERITGTALIVYNQEKLDAEIAFGVVLRLLGLEKEVEKRPESLLSTGIHNASDAVNRALYEKTAGIIDLRTLIPIMLAAFGTYKITRPGGLNLPGGFTLLWWAYLQLFSGEKRR